MLCLTPLWNIWRHRNHVDAFFRTKCEGWIFVMWCFSNNFFYMWLQSVQDHFQHHFTGMTDEDDGSIIMTLLYDTFLWEWCWPLFGLSEVSADSFRMSFTSMFYQVSWNVACLLSFSIPQWSYSCFDLFTHNRKVIIIWRFLDYPYTSGLIVCHVVVKYFVHDQ